MREKRNTDNVKNIEVKNKQDEEEFGDFMVDLNKVKRANTNQGLKKQISIEKDTAFSSNTNSKQSTKPYVSMAGTGGLQGMVRAARINQKKVQMQQPTAL